MNARTAAIAVSAAFVLAALLGRVLLTHAPSNLVANDLAQPLAVVTNWGSFGARFVCVFFAALGIATIAYEHARRKTSLRTSLAVAAAALACGALMPVLFSSDIYAYAAYGEAARTGLDPYVRVTLPLSDPIFAAAVRQWGNPLPMCVYGPVFVAISAATVGATHAFGVVTQLDALRLVAALALVACLRLAYVVYPGDAPARAIAAATIGLNPVAIWCAVEGHNDAIALAVVLGGFALARSGRYAFGGAVAALAATIKLPGLAAAVAAAFFDRRARIGAAIGGAAAIAISLPLLRGALTQLAPHGRYAPQASFEAIVKPLALALLRDDAIATAATWAIALAAAAACAWCGVRRLRRQGCEGWIYVALGIWLLIPNPYPWYALWLLPVAALAPRTRPAAVAIWLSLASVLRYVPDAVGALAPVPAALLGIAATLPLAALFVSE